MSARATETSNTPPITLQATTGFTGAFQGIAFTFAQAFLKKLETAFHAFLKKLSPVFFFAPFVTAFFLSAITDTSKFFYFFYFLYRQGGEALEVPRGVTAMPS
jgi:hypothetical protein